ncbi:hypothetical protein RGU76_03010 [Bacillus pseudomycoides]|uniref:hypothetical protein n=1 Tax=Bacillus TaxID=1386 RepID=UPI0022489AD6|nr:MULTISPECIES: hypothetical protein [Bacillus]MCX2828587.1 hypothetical protein [Bacillus sp. DHT2]MDR4914103.1 hypothetical protein [Bacillus pseudomycoides]
MKLLKSKALWGAVGAIVVASTIAYNVGTIPGDAEVNGKVTTYKSLVSNIEQKENLLDKTEKELKTTKEGLDKLNAELKLRSAEFEGAKKLVGNKINIENEIKNKQSELDGKKSEISKLDGDINAKKAELQKLTEGVVLKQQEPKKLGAGYWSVGKDIPAGRYKITGKSNLFVYSSSGGTKVNVILGGGDFGLESYVVAIVDGDIIDTRGGATFQAIQ